MVIDPTVELIVDLILALHDSPTILSKPSLVSTVYQYPAGFRAKIPALLEQEDTELAVMISKMVSGGVSETLIRECNSLLREIDETDLELGVALVESLRHYMELPWAADYSEVDSHLRAQCLALINTATALRSIGASNALMEIRFFNAMKDCSLVADSQLVRALVDDPLIAPEVTKVIRTHRVESYAQITALMEGVVAPLVGGSL